MCLNFPIQTKVETMSVFTLLTLMVEVLHFISALPQRWKNIKTESRQFSSDLRLCLFVKWISFISKCFSRGKNT